MGKEKLRHFSKTKEKGLSYKKNKAYVKAHRARKGR
jgi:hypothetical protein